MTMKTFGDIRIGEEFRSAGRTITETDIMQFAGLTGDFNPLHVDEVWASRNTPYGGRIAHGLLVQGIGEGLYVAGPSEWFVLAFLEVQRKMVAPVRAGDTISQLYRVSATRPSSKDPSRGIVEVEIEISNQHGETVQTGLNKYLIGGAG